MAEYRVVAFPDVHMTLQPLPNADAAVARLAAQARHDLGVLAHPAAAWVKPLAHPSGEHVYDVVIVGAGQAGLIVGLALKREGVRNVLLLDRNPNGYEGPWDTFARMETLRTPKTLVGAELNIPSLGVRAWFEARYGAEAWEKITWIPRRDWMRYLRWYRSVADLDIRNETEVTGIVPDGQFFTIKTAPASGDGRVLARRVVICTGHEGGGVWGVPDIVSRALPTHAYTHSNVRIDFATLTGKRIGILGHGGSAFDAGLTALQAGPPQSISAFGARVCRWSTRIAGSNGRRFWRIIATSTTGPAGMSAATSICMTSHRRAIPTTERAPNRDCKSTANASGARFRGPARGSR
jgi:hypothetical protein